jgi:hypothetical protein
MRCGNEQVRYLEDPSRLPSLLNYTLYHHAMTLDYTRAEQLYDKGYQVRTHTLAPKQTLVGPVDV